MTPHPYQGCALPLSYDGGAALLALGPMGCKPSALPHGTQGTLQIVSERLRNLPILTGDSGEVCSPSGRGKVRTCPRPSREAMAGKAPAVRAGGVLRAVLAFCCGDRP